MDIFWDIGLTRVARALSAYMQSNSHMRGALGDLRAHADQLIANIEPCGPEEAITRNVRGATRRCHGS